MLQDLDSTGIKGMVIGTPGDNDGGLGAGAIYIIFIRRRRYHPPFVDHLKYLLIILIPVLTGFCCCVGAVLFFIYYFRRRADDIELIVMKSGLEVSKSRKRKVVDFKNLDSKVYADDYG